MASVAAPRSAMALRSVASSTPSFVDRPPAGEKLGQRTAYCVWAIVGEVTSLLRHDNTRGIIWDLQELDVSPSLSA